jgi:serine/threonine protein phosphatase PrpC
MSTVAACPSLIRAYLANIQSALVNQQDAHAEMLLQHAMELLPSDQSDAPLLQPPSPLQLTSGVGLHPGKKRQCEPNQDYTFAVSGILPGTGEHFGLFIVADGMGGHLNGQDASRLATHEIVDDILPKLYRKHRGSDQSEDVLCQAVNKANASIAARNEAAKAALDMMGTTLTAALVVDTHMVIVNVGDSRTYLYRSGVGLRQVTCDHSVVQKKVELGVIGPDDIYTHPERNLITRSLGAGETVEVDVFHEDLCDNDILLLCSDGMWEMTRDPKIEEVLRNPQLSPSHMAERLVYLALQGGGLDNIGLVVVQVSVVDIAALSTMIFPLSDLALLPS